MRHYAAVEVLTTVVCVVRLAENVDKHTIALESVDSAEHMLVLDAVLSENSK